MTNFIDLISLFSFDVLNSFHTGKQSFEKLPIGQNQLYRSILSLTASHTHYMKTSPQWLIQKALKNKSIKSKTRLSL